MSHVGNAHMSTNSCYRHPVASLPLPARVSTCLNGHVANQNNCHRAMYMSKLCSREHEMRELAVPNLDQTPKCTE